MSGIRVGVDLCHVDPAALGHADHALLDALGAMAADPADDVEVVLFSSRSLARARPEVFGALESHAFPFPPGSVLGRLAAQRTWLRFSVRRAGLDVWHDAGGTSPGLDRPPDGAVGARPRAARPPPGTRCPASGP